MYLQYCLIANMAICVLSLILFYVMKKKNQASRENTITLVFSTVLAMACATFAPLISDYFINNLSFNIVGSVLVSIVTLLTLALAVFYLILPKVVKWSENKAEETAEAEEKTEEKTEEKAEEGKSESIIEKIISAFAQPRPPEKEEEEQKNDEMNITEADITGEEAITLEDDTTIEIELPSAENLEEAEPEVYEIMEETEPEVYEITEETEPEVYEITEESEPEIYEITEEAEPEVYEITEESEPEVYEITEESEPEVYEITEETEPEVYEITEEVVPPIYENREYAEPDLIEIPVYSSDKQSDIMELLDRALDAKINRNFQDAISSYESALILNPDDELCYHIILDLCSLYKITGKSESIYKLLQSSQCKLLTQDKKEDILRNIQIS